MVTDEVLTDLNQAYFTQGLHYSLEIEMNKLLTTLFAGAFALSLGTAAFAADAAKTAEPVKATATKAAEPAKVEAVKAAEPAAVTPAADATKAAPAKAAKKHHRKYAKHAKKAVEAAPDAAPAALTGK